MNPVVLICRTTFGDAYRYRRYGEGYRGKPPVMTDAVETVPTGGDPAFLPPEDVETLRVRPQQIVPKEPA